MSPEKKQTLKLLKVDNWSVFLLQRLQLMFAKGDCCDMTLKFDSGQELKVHKLVLTTCTKFFESMSDNNNTFYMPATLSYNSMLPIINFMYSGKLEFKPVLQDNLLNAAKILNMTILVQLLIAQKTSSEAKIKLATRIDDQRKSVRIPNQIDSSTLRPLPISMLAEKKPEDPRPTRFELPSEETSSLMMNVPSFTEISYESEPVVPSPSDFTLREKEEGPVKRRVVPPPSVAHRKAQKLTESQIISGNWSDEDDDAHFESLHSYEDSDEEQGESNTTTNIVTSTPKPILKPSAETAPASSSKKVRFCLSKEDKENSEEYSEVPLSVEGLPPKADDRVVKNVQQNEKPKEENVPNHAKIIAEVLKKFPDLVKNNKNIKLKITSPAGSSVKTVSLENTKNVPSTPKSSYVVVKPNTVKVEPQPPQSCPEAENITGPWICKRCTIDQRHLIFESYYLFRKHLIDVHLERIDPKICEICGYKASKKNLHLFHLYTKHGIQPPKNIKFPKCTQCKYVALNDTLLAKHCSTHQVASKELICNICKLSFKSTSSFQAHCVTCKPNSEIRTYPCKNCHRIFRTNVSLRAHFKDCRGEVGTSQLINRNIEPVEMIEVPIMETVSNQKGEHSLVQLPSGIIVTESPNMALLHPDGNGLSNVTSTIPNIGFTVLPEDHQTVILLDENSEFFLQGNNSVVVTSENNGDEYVVPEILQDNMAQLYSTSNISYTVNGTSVITYPVVHVQQDGTIQDHSNNTLTTIPVSQSGELFVSNKEITISGDLQTEGKSSDSEGKMMMQVQGDKDEPMQITPEQEVVQQDTVTPTTCIVRIDSDNMTMVQGDTVCLVDSNTPISIMDSDGASVNISDNTPVSIMDADTPISIMDADTPVSLMDADTPVSIMDADTPVSIVDTDTSVSIVHPSNTVSIINSDGMIDSKPTVISVAPHEEKEVQDEVNSELKVKADQISTEWDFDAEEEDSEVVDDPDSRPSRPTIELQEIV